MCTHLINLSTKMDVSINKNVRCSNITLTNKCAINFQNISSHEFQGVLERVRKKNTYNTSLLILCD